MTSEMGSARGKVLLTGMSGTGKSSVLDELRSRGFATIDMDEAGWSRHDENGCQLWNESRLQKALDACPGKVLFVAGCAENQVRFYPHFTHIILLSAPQEVLLERIRNRTNNPYGKSPQELAEILHNLQTIEPLLRRRATHEVVTTAPLDHVIAEVLRMVNS